MKGSFRPFLLLLSLWQSNLFLDDYDGVGVKKELRHQPGNTERRGKYYCVADLLFDWYGFDQTSKSVVRST